ncbi:Hypothetical protein R9X50_00097500 [Acrodontium crateriforme]|uniref:Peptidase S8/S53 domain-containing protein n=1 Tax=Acrodontium crateriforme TaxID=150365 RepID=A0AAQ3LZV7_9PEZI|nr:Hypothetical protein R9X50_00097500 [Acrodontium crateriforme]
MYLDGDSAIYGGTSMSCPILAIINRIVEERLAIGKVPIAFLNPSSYSDPSMLTDITKGHNDGCGTKGFNTAKVCILAAVMGPNRKKVTQNYASFFSASMKEAQTNVHDAMVLENPGDGIKLAVATGIYINML